MKKKLRYFHLPTKAEIQKKNKKRIKKEKERKALRKLFENYLKNVL